MKYPTPINTLQEIGGATCVGIVRLDCAGAGAPHHVIRGESTNNTQNSWTESQITFIDYISFTVRNTDSDYKHFPLENIINDLFGIPVERLRPLGRGRHGYKKCVDFSGHGCILFGGKSQRDTVHVQISGSGCKLVEDWLAVYTWAVNASAKLIRLDLAHDDVEGKQIDIKSAIGWYEQGLFSSNGRPPKRHLQDDFDDGSGKTFYVGTRGNSRYVRIYEKGKQLGNRESKWCRAEIEFRAVDQFISWTALYEPDQFFSGAYKAFSFLTSTQSKFERINREENISFDRALRWGRIHIGQFINLLCLKHNNDFEKVVSDLRRDGIPKKLESYHARFILSSRTE